MRFCQTLSKNNFSFIKINAVAYFTIVIPSRFKLLGPARFWRVLDSYRDWDPKYTKKNY